MIFSVHILAYNEQRFMEWALRHWATVANVITVHDLGSTDSTTDIARRWDACVVRHDTKGVTDDLLNREIKETCWRDEKADWVAVVDCDELLFFPDGCRKTLERYDMEQWAIIKPEGWEMFSETTPDISEAGQVYEQVTQGARDDYWYGKPCLFSPRRVQRLSFSCGAHSVDVWNRGARRGYRYGQNTPATQPRTQLLHFHHIRPIEEIAADYDAHVRRMGAANKKHGWGWQGEGMQHALEKRRKILAGLQPVFEPNARTETRNGTTLQPR